MTISTDGFKAVQAHLAGAVTVITTCDADGQPWGLTATSFCSLSLDPPLVLFCLAHDADSYEAFATSKFFAVNMLTARQSDLSQRFATKGRAKYQGIHFEAGQSGAPLLPATLAHLECSTHAIYPGGDHIIIVGLVEHGSWESSSADAAPLIYYKRQYGTFAQAEPSIEQRDEAASNHRRPPGQP